MGKRKGFSIIELLVVIAVLGILVSIAAYSYRNWKNTALSNQVQSDVRQAATAMESAKNFSSGYPLSLPSTFTASSGVTVVWTSGTTTTFCLNGSSTTDATIHYYVTNTTITTGPQSGTCT